MCYLLLEGASVQSHEGRDRIECVICYLLLEGASVQSHEGRDRIEYVICYLLLEGVLAHAVALCCQRK